MENILDFDKGGKAAILYRLGTRETILKCRGRCAQTNVIEMQEKTQLSGKRMVVSSSASILIVCTPQYSSVLELQNVFETVMHPIIIKGSLYMFCLYPKPVHLHLPPSSALIGPYRITPRRTSGMVCHESSMKACLHHKDTWLANQEL